jgi:predicted nucleic acid-binding protein
MQNTIITDTGPIVALFNRNDKYYDTVMRFLQSYTGALITTWPVITEATHLLRASIAAQLNLLEWIRRGGLRIYPLDSNEIDRLIALTHKYRDLPMDLADGSLIVLAENEGLREIISIDSDYDVYRIFKKEPFINRLRQI